MCYKLQRLNILLNFIGYGCTISENGKLYNDLSKLSTTLNIFSKIKSK